MNRITSSIKSLVVAGVAFGALGAASLAQARTDVTVHIGTPASVVQPVQYRVAPAPQHLPVYDNGRYDRRGGPNGDSDRDGIPNRFDRDSRHYDWRAARNHPQFGDYDRDGVPNFQDRAPHNPRRY